jgi:hypothetical protein
MSRSTTRSRRSVFLPLALAAAALTAGLALLGGTPGTFAFLSDSTSQPAKTVTAGGLNLAITQSSEWVSTTGTTTAGSTASTVAVGTTGYVPGQRGQKLTFTLTNAATSATPATLASTLSSGTFWADLAAKNLLSITPTVVSGPCSVGALATTSSSVSIPVSSTGALRPGASCVVSFTVAIPTGSSSTDAATYLRGSMKASVAAFTMAGTLTQAAR